MRQTGTATPNANKTYEIQATDLPLHCPLPSMSLWNSHPRVFLPITEAKNGKVICPYCGTEYTLAAKNTLQKPT
jgi:uncharacterized Zn-finger protein